MITVNDVKKISELVKVPLKDGEGKKLAVMFSDTLKTIEILNELDTSKVSETYQVSGLTNVFQTPQDATTLPKEEVLRNAKDTKRGLISTRGVLDRE